MKSSAYGVTYKTLYDKGCSPSTVHGAFTRLIKKNLIKKTNKKNGHHWVYTGTIPKEKLKELLNG